MPRTLDTFYPTTVTSLNFQMHRLQLAGQDSSLKMYANIQYVIYLLKENISKDKNSAYAKHGYYFKFFLLSFNRLL